MKDRMKKSGRTKIKKTNEERKEVNEKERKKGK